MHEPWEDLIPQYVAGTLHVHERIALEKHLASCAHCQAQVIEWQQIAMAVRAEAEMRTVALPPISMRVREGLHAARPAPQVMASPVVTQPMLKIVEKKYPRRIPSFTLAAAVASVIFIGAILLFMTSTRTRTATENATNVALGLTEQATETETSDTTAVPDFAVTFQVTNTPILAATRPSGNDLGILMISPTVTPPAPASPTVLFTPVPLVSQPTSILPPTGTLPFGGGGGGEEMNSNEFMMPAETGDTGSMLTGECQATNNTVNSVRLYATASANSDVVGILPPGETRRVTNQSGSGWYQLIGLEPMFGIAGWVNGNDITLTGNCGGLLIPTATLESFAPTPFPDSVCRVSSATGSPAPILSGPGGEFFQIAQLTPGELVMATAQSDNGYLRINLRFPTAGYTTGWVLNGSTTQNGPCTDLPILPAVGFLPPTPDFPSPTMTPQLPPVSRTPVRPPDSDAAQPGPTSTTSG